MAKPLPTLVPAVWTGGLLPVAMIGLDWYRDALGANPVSSALHQLGRLALIGLVATLACTPVQLLTRWAWPVRIRQALGLLSFTYVTLHLLVYVVLDQGLALRRLAEDVAKKPFITIGFFAWLLLIPLALTSTAASVRKLGFAQWKRVHRLSYAIAALGVIHFAWGQKKDITEPVIYGLVLAALLGVRAMEALRKRSRARA